MTRVVLAVGVLALSVLACTQAVVTPSPVPTVANTSTAVPTLARATQTAPAPRTVETATVLRAVVNVREVPGGKVVGYLEAGQVVTVLECTDDYCKISTGVLTGYVWRGCISGNDDRRCEAR